MVLEYLHHTGREFSHKAQEQTHVVHHVGHEESNQFHLAEVHLFLAEVVVNDSITEPSVILSFPSRWVAVCDVVTAESEGGYCE